MVKMTLSQPYQCTDCQKPTETYYWNQELPGWVCWQCSPYKADSGSESHQNRSERPKQ